MAQFWKATSVSVSNGSNLVTVNVGDSVDLIRERSFLQIANNQVVEVIRAYIDGGGISLIELQDPWSDATQTSQPAVAVATVAELAQLIDDVRLLTTAAENIQNAYTDYVKNNIINKTTADGIRTELDVAQQVSSLLDNTAGLGLIVGSHGVGGTTLTTENGDLDLFKSNSAVNVDVAALNKPTVNAGILISRFVSGTDGHQTYIETSSTYDVYRRRCASGIFSTWVKLLDGGNTIVDGNGFVKEASPVIRLFDMGLEFNSFFDVTKIDNPTYEKIDTGVYQVIGVEGFSKDGWYIQTPEDANGNKKVKVEYSYDTKTKTIEVKTFDPVSDEPKNIPDGRWIDLRVEI